MNSPRSAIALPFALIAMLAFSSTGNSATLCFIPHDPNSDGPRWDFEIGIAYITTNNIGEIAQGTVNVGSGPDGGEIYNLTASRRLGEFEFRIGNHLFRPQVELPLTLEIVDENSRGTFLDYNASIMLRWIDFPWNNHVKTSFAMGLGLSYSEKVYLMDISRHPNEDRSHLKFNWPIQWTFAHPNHPDHQLLLFISHQSGGHIFDEGGINSIGFGFRSSF